MHNRTPRKVATIAPVIIFPVPDILMSLMTKGRVFKIFNYIMKNGK
jgi:hypothetical protein